MEISKLTDLTVYEVSRIVDWDHKNKFSVSFHIAEFFNNKPAKHQHTIYRHHEADAYRTAENRSTRTGLRHRLVDDDGRVLDLVG